MTDEEIELAISQAVDIWLSTGKTMGRGLAFSHNGAEGSYNVFWDKNQKDWDYIGNDVDPLSLYLLKERPEAKTVHIDDDQITTTLASVFDRPYGWIHSFQCGWFNIANSSSSITAYLLGFKLRTKYLKL